MSQWTQIIRAPMKIKHRHGPDTGAPRILLDQAELKLSPYEKLQDVINAEVTRFHVMVCSNRQGLSYEETRQLALLGQEIREMEKFKVAHETDSELAKMSNEQLAEALKARAVK